MLTLPPPLYRDENDKSVIPITLAAHTMQDALRQRFCFVRSDRQELERAHCHTILDDDDDDDVDSGDLGHDDHTRARPVGR